METSDAQTISCLLQSIDTLGIPEDHIVVPNPDPAQLDGIHRLFPGVKTVNLTSHEFLEALKNSRVECLNSSDFSSFDFVWLDYCGTFASRAGRKRQGDIRILFEQGLLSPNSLLVTTLTKRGASIYYKDEIVDQIISYMAHVAAETKRVVECTGVATYAISGKIYTVAFRVGARSAETRGQNEPLVVKTFLNTSEESSNALENKQKRKRQAGSNELKLYSRWNLFENIDEGTVLWKVTLNVCSKFMSKCIESSTGTTALILDNKLLPACRTLVGKNFCGPIFVLFSDPRTDYHIAKYVLKSCKSSKSLGCTTLLKSTWQHFVMGRAQPAELGGLNFGEIQTVWLGYEGVCRTTRSLQNCHTWQDLHFLLSNGALSNGAECHFGLFFKYIMTGQCWQHSAIDWTVRGIIRAAKQYGIQMVCTYACTFSVNSPYLCAIFTCGKENNEVTDHICAAKLEHKNKPKRWQEWQGWDFHRVKVATPAAAKYKRCALAVLQLVRKSGAKNAILHEPGWFHVLPKLLQGEDVNILACAGNDFVQHDELIYRHVKAGSSPTFECCLSPSTISNLEHVDTLVLLCEGGWRRWLDEWAELVQRWVASFSSGTEKKTKLLIALASKGAAQVSHSFIKDILSAGRAVDEVETPPEVSMLKPISLTSEGLAFDMPCWVFSEDENTLEACQKLFHVNV